MASQPSAARAPLFAPKLLTVLAEGYRLAHLRADITAGLTVAVVALPLSMAIAIASGAGPAAGLTTSIVGGFLVSALGGSRFQIGGPAGAFIVLVASTVARHGLAGLATATLISGLLLTLIGLFRIGRYVKYIPFPVTLGFTAGIGAIILASQLRPFLGLTLGGPEPGPILEKIPALWQAAATLNLTAVALGAVTMAIIYAGRRLAPRVPAMLVAVAVAALATWALGLPIATIGSEFGGIARGMPWPVLPDLSLHGIIAVLPDAISFTVLGAIESLLSAVVADSMSGRRHRPDTELIAQGIANMASALVGGLPVTGTIARTATNVRAGAHGPFSGMIHSLALLVFVLALAPLASSIPLAALAGVLITVSLHMIDPVAVWRFARDASGEAVVLFATLGFTLFRDLMTGIMVGTSLGAILLVQRMAQLTTAMPVGLPETPFDLEDHGHVTMRITGSFFFGSAPIIEQALERTAVRPRVLTLDISAVPLIDSSGAQSLVRLARHWTGQGTEVRISGAAQPLRKPLAKAGLPDSVIFD